MSNQVKTTIGVGGTALLVILATNAKPLFEGLQAGWIFFTSITSKATLGVGAFLLALTVATLSMWFLDKWIPRGATEHGKLGRSFLLELAALAIGLYLTYIQIPVPMLGLMVGTIAGLAAPLCYKAARGLSSWISSIFSQGGGNADVGDN